MLWVVTKSDERAQRCLSSVEEAAVRAAAGGGGAGDEAFALEVLREVREHDHWLACDCRAEADRRPLVAPCRLPERAGYTWRVLAGEHRIAHAQACVFFRLERERREQAAWSRAARLAPRGFFSVLVEPSEGERLGAPKPPAGPGEGRRRRVPALSRLLLELMQTGGLTRVTPDNVEGGWEWAAWQAALERAAGHYSIAPGQALAPLFFTWRGDWDDEVIHTKLSAAAKGWPAGEVAQAFVCWFVSKLDKKRGLAATRTFEAAPVVRAIQRPVIGRIPVAEPYLFIGVVGEVRGRKGYRLARGYAQPVVAAQWPVPVDSHHERRAFGTLRWTLKRLSERFPRARFELVKPVFESETPEGPCLPDFLIRAARGDEVVVFVIEVMGFERPSYLEGKEVTHPRMERLGTLLKMDGSAFAGGGVKQEGRRVTETIIGQLRSRWG